MKANLTRTGIVPLLLLGLAVVIPTTADSQTSGYVNGYVNRKSELVKYAPAPARWNWNWNSSYNGWGYNQSYSYGYQIVYEFYQGRTIVTTYPGRPGVAYPVLYRNR